MDYCFPQGNREGALKVIALRCPVMRATGAMVVPSKGLVENWVAERCAKYIDNLGMGRMRLLLKSDQEPSLEAVREAVIRLRGAQTDTGAIDEESPVGVEP